MCFACVVIKLANLYKKRQREIVSNFVRYHTMYLCQHFSMVIFTKQDVRESNS